MFIYSSLDIGITQSIIDFLDPDQELIDGFLTIKNCLVNNDEYVIKPLKLIKNRELKNMVIVTSKIECCYFNLENAIPITPWKNNADDKELKFLVEFLLEAVRLDDLMEHNARKFKLQKLMNMLVNDLKK